MTGRFAVIEGIDGTGKTTQQEMLVSHLKNAGRNAIAINSPSEWYRQQPDVADFINNGSCRLGANTLAALAAADRMLAGDKIIRPAIESGTDVVSARYTASALAYAKQRGAAMKFVRDVNSQVVRPSHGLLLKIDPDLALERITSRGIETTHEERIDYLAAIQDTMLEEWPSNFLIVDALLPKEEILGRMAWYMDKDEA